jgi:hypothetical protein
LASVLGVDEGEQSSGSGNGFGGVHWCVVGLVEKVS